MTLPDERYRAVMRTRQLLLNLCNPDHTPGVSDIVREEAMWCLRHYPTEYWMDQVAEQMPGVFAKEMEPVYRLIKKYEDKNNETT
jgi:hypothetical protein